MQQIFAANRGSAVIPVTRDGKPLTGQDGLFASAALDDRGGTILKIVNAGETSIPVRLESTSKRTGTARATFIAVPLMAENSLAYPDVVKPAEEDVAVTAGVIERTLLPYSVTGRR